MNPEDLLGKVPWITPQGYFDPGKYPIDGVLKQAEETARQMEYVYQP